MDNEDALALPLANIFVIHRLFYIVLVPEP